MTSNLETLLADLEARLATFQNSPAHPISRESAIAAYELGKWPEYLPDLLATIRDLSARVETARVEALEEAAKVAETCIPWTAKSLKTTKVAAQGAMRSATAIRALKESRHG